MTEKPSIVVESDASTHGWGRPATVFALAALGLRRGNPWGKPSRLATNNTVDMETEPSEIQFENGSDHAVVASYSELYEEGEVEISTVPPTLLGFK